MKNGAVWTFKTKRFCVMLKLEQDYGYRYDGDDPDGETQAKLDSGEYVAFDSDVVVYLDGEEIGRDSLGGSVYDANNVREFWTAHRDPDPKNRNCAANAYRIGHYFPGMVAEACKEARAFLAKAPRVRSAA
jgi:hypothetical protein